MDEKTTELIERLAAKLGTTADHLWGVLLRQAPISSMTSAAIIFVFAAVLFLAFRLAREVREEDSAAFAWIYWVIGVIVFTICATISAHNIATGLLNPEFWALDYILDAVK